MCPTFLCPPSGSTFVVFFYFFNAIYFLQLHLLNFNLDFIVRNSNNFALIGFCGCLAFIAGQASNLEGTPCIFISMCVDHASQPKQIYHEKYCFITLQNGYPISFVHFHCSSLISPFKSQLV